MPSILKLDRSCKEHWSVLHRQGQSMNFINRNIMRACCAAHTMGVPYPPSHQKRVLINARPLKNLAIFTIPKKTMDFFEVTGGRVLSFRNVSVGEPARGG
jgi:hypothetical protein